MAEWMIRLTGDELDLAWLAAALPDGDLRITVADEAHYLLGLEFEPLPDADAVRRRAEPVIACLNGLAKTYNPDCRSVGFGGVRRQNGSAQEFRWAEDTFRMIGDTVRAAILRADGTVKELGTTQTFDSEAAVAHRESNVAKGLSLFGTGAKDWRELYKVLEVVAKDVGGLQQIVAAGWASQAALTLFKRTGNSSSATQDAGRHGTDRGQQPPPNPMALEKATELIREILRAWISTKS